MANNPKDFIQTKTDVEPYAGGCPVNLKKKIRGKGTVKEELQNDLSAVLEKEIQNQDKYIKKIQKWNKLFKGIKKDKTFPYAGCSNLAIPLARWLIETVVVRVFDALFSQVKFWVVRPIEEDWVDIAPELEDALDWWQKWIAKFRKTIFSPLLQCAKVGTGVVKLDYERRKRTIYRYATPKEKKDPGIKKYAAKNGEMLIKEPQTVYDGPVLKAIDRKDFVISSDARNIQDAFLVGFKTRISKPTFELRAKNKFYTLTSDEIDAILVGDELDETEKKRIEDANKDYREEQGMIEVWELWLRYDVDNDGEPDDIVVSFHKGTSTVLRAIYNPYFYGFRPFKELIFNPVEYSFDGTGMCEILEHLAEEMDTVHNQRIDRMNNINAPPLKRRSGSICKNIEYVRPGQIVDVDEMDDLQEFNFADVYPSTWQEEMRIEQIAQTVVGVSNAVMGQSTAERPVARETLALIQEANKKFKFGIDNLRADLEEIGIMVLEMFAQFAPTLTYKVEETGGFDTKSVNFPLGYIRDGVKVELMASSEVENTEVKREKDLTLYQLISDYATKLAGMAQALESPQIPPGFKNFIYEVAKIGTIYMKRIVKDFGGVDAETMVPDLEKIIPREQAMQPPPQQMPPQGGPPQGPPPQGQMGGQQGQNIPPTPFG